MTNIESLRADFPALHQQVHGKPLVYLDNAATTQKPNGVINRILRYYREDCSNIHRGVHALSERATRDYEAARIQIQRFLNARESREIIFTHGTTEAINLVAHSIGRAQVKAGDTILISTMEHHSNIVPWQILCAEKGATLAVIPINDRGEIILEEYSKLLTTRTRLVGLVHVSNSLGTINPVRTMIEMAHSKGIPVLIDGAQALSHFPVDVQALDCDFYAFSGHKLFGPTGIGVLYGKANLLESMPPFLSGGDMISSVTFAKTTYNKLPYKFEAGTPHVAGGIGLGAAVEYFTSLDRAALAAHEADLLNYATASLAEIKGLRIIGTAAEKVSVLSFVLQGAHPHDIGTILDREGIAIRTGHHCTQPVMERFEVPATARASFAFYNTRQEIDALVSAIHKVRKQLRIGN